MSRSKRRTSKRPFGAAVRGLIKSQSETKWYDQILDDHPLTSTSTGVVQSVFQIPIGTGPNQRIGNRIRIVALHIDAVVVGVSPAAYYKLRQVLYKRKAALSLFAPGTNLLQYLEPNVYVTKKDVYTRLEPSGGGYSSQARFTYHKRWPTSSGGQIVDYNGPGSLDVQSGFWQLWTATDNTSFGDLLMSYRFRVFYKDM